jgi:hypothetical protein
VKYRIGVRAVVNVIKEIRNGCRRRIVEQVDLEIANYSLEFNDGCIRNSRRTTESNCQEKIATGLIRELRRMMYPVIPLQGQCRQK